MIAQHDIDHGIYICNVNQSIARHISMNDNMCAGALEVIKDDPAYDGTWAYGVDGTAEACLYV